MSRQRPWGAPSAESSNAAAAGDKSFGAHFEAHIAPHFEALEDRRQVLCEQFKTRRLYVWVMMAGLFAAGAFAYNIGALDGLQTDLWKIAIAVFVLVFFFGWAWACGPKREFRSSYKSRILPNIAAFFGDFHYTEKGGITMHRLKPSTLIPSHNRYTHEDLFAGRYKDVHIEFCEALLTERRGSGKNRRTVTVFKGVFVLLEMNKRFKGMTVVRRDAGMVGNWFRDRFSGRLEPVKLEDPEFEKRFEVYSDDQIEARYLLTPAFMTRLEALAGAVRAQGLQAAFYDSMLMIMLPGAGGKKSIMSNFSSVGKQMSITGKAGNLFEPGSIHEPVNSTGDVDRLTEEFRSIIEIVDRLKLDEKTRV